MMARKPPADTKKPAAEGKKPAPPKKTTRPAAAPVAAASTPARAKNRSSEPLIEDDRTGMDQPVLRRAFLDNLNYTLAKDQTTWTPRDRFMALACTVRDRLVARWIETQKSYYRKDAKRVYYMSAEFLMGRSLANNLINLGIYQQCRDAFRDLGVDLDEALDQESDAGLGNGGLGRLAACYLDSMATLAIPGTGYGIRYEFGIFEQKIQEGYQVEQPDNWLRFGNPWEFPRPEYLARVQFGGRTEAYLDTDGNFRIRWVDTEDVLGMPYDTPIAGYGNNTVNNLRLWQARAVQELDFREFDQGDYDLAVQRKTASENISKVLYPNDNSMQGKELRLKQQYFFVSCSVQDIVRRYLKTHKSFKDFPNKVTIQLNDTHPSLAVAELLRLLLDVYKLPWAEAWDITWRTFAYTNHTLLPEALEKWPVSFLERLLPRHLELIYEINSRFLDEVRRRNPGRDDLLRKMSLVEENPKMIRMAHLAVVGSYSINGVAELHTKLLTTRVLPAFAELYPERFNNKTNGVTPRRWVKLANPGLAALFDEICGPAWVTNLDKLSALEKHVEDPAFQKRFRAIKQDNKKRLAQLVQERNGLDLDLNSMFDIQIKRFHEYKRQHLNALHVIYLYNRIKRNPDAPFVPRTFIFAGKSAPGYAMAKLIIKLLNSIAQVVNHDKDVRGRIQVVFMENYGVTLAERMIPGADLSEQISTAGYEASGTGNMKFALNGALTIGTLDGANVEIRQRVGDQNFFLFGLKAEEVVDLRARGYKPYSYYESDPNLRAVLDSIARNKFSPSEPGVFNPLLAELLGVDRFMVLADFAAYVTCQERVESAFADQAEWTRKAIRNVARCGYFSSDRAVREYAEEIWESGSVPVVLPDYRGR
ncbi:MAG: glycogen/starch/alpha-glucan phosphorylase [Candidatus Eremiobacterota bacterium]